jgi:hypothetical protein
VSILDDHHRQPNCSCRPSSIIIVLVARIRTRDLEGDYQLGRDPKLAVRPSVQAAGDHWSHSYDRQAQVA